MKKIRESEMIVREAKSHRFKLTTEYRQKLLKDLKKGKMAKPVQKSKALLKKKNGGKKNT